MRMVDQVIEAFVLMGNGNGYFTEALTDAYHRAGRKIAVVTTTFGPGLH